MISTPESFGDTLASDLPYDLKVILLRHYALQAILETPEILEKIEPARPPRAMREGVKVVSQVIDDVVLYLGEKELARDPEWTIKSLLDGKLKLRHNDGGVLVLPLGHLQSLRDLLVQALPA